LMMQQMFGYDPMMMNMMSFDPYEGYDMSYDMGYQQQYHSRGRGYNRGRGRGFEHRQRTEVVVPGAPSAPKAMLSGRGGRGSVFSGNVPPVEKKDISSATAQDNVSHEDKISSPKNERNPSRSASIERKSRQSSVVETTQIQQENTPAESPKNDEEDEDVISLGSISPPRSTTPISIKKVETSHNHRRRSRADTSDSSHHRKRHREEKEEKSRHSDRDHRHRHDHSKHSSRHHRHRHRERSQSPKRHRRESPSEERDRKRSSKHQSHSKHSHRHRENGKHRETERSGDKDTRRRSIHYEDDIEETTRQIERERESQRWR
jgi:hypothetical protein